MDLHLIYTTTLDPLPLTPYILSMHIPSHPFHLVVSANGRVLGAAPLRGEPWSPGFAPNFVDTCVGEPMMLVAVTVLPCTMEAWGEIVRGAGTWERAGTLAVREYGGTAWPTLPTDGGAVLPYVHPGVTGEA